MSIGRPMALPIPKKALPVHVNGALRILSNNPMAALVVGALGLQLQAGCGPQRTPLRASRSPVCLDPPADHFLYHLSYETALQLQSLSHSLADEVRARLEDAYEPTTRLAERTSQVPIVAKLTAGIKSGVEAATPVIRSSIDAAVPVLRSGFDAADPVVRAGMEMAGKQLASGVRAVVPVVRSGMESAGKEIASNIAAAIPVIRHNIETSLPVIGAGVQTAATATLSGFLAGFGIEYGELARSVLLVVGDTTRGALGATVEVSAPALNSGVNAGVNAAAEALSAAPAAVEVASQAAPSAAEASAQVLSTGTQAAADGACALHPPPGAAEAAEAAEAAGPSVNSAAASAAPSAGAAATSAGPSVGSVASAAPSAGSAVATAPSGLSSAVPSAGASLALTPHAVLPV
jgi:hypothetical protein